MQVKSFHDAQAENAYKDQAGAIYMPPLASKIEDLTRCSYSDAEEDDDVNESSQTSSATSNQARGKKTLQWLVSDGMTSLSSTKRHVSDLGHPSLSIIAPHNCEQIAALIMFFELNTLVKSPTMRVPSPLGCSPWFQTTTGIIFQHYYSSLGSNAPNAPSISLDQNLHTKETMYIDEASNLYNPIQLKPHLGITNELQCQAHDASLFEHIVEIATTANLSKPSLTEEFTTISPKNSCSKAKPCLGVTTKKTHELLKLIPNHPPSFLVYANEHGERFKLIKKAKGWMTKSNGSIVTCTFNPHTRLENYIVMEGNIFQQLPQEPLVTKEQPR